MKKTIVLIFVTLLLCVGLLSGCVSIDDKTYQGKVRMKEHMPFDYEEDYEFLYIDYKGNEHELKTDKFSTKLDFDKFKYCLENNCTIDFTFVWWFGIKELKVKDLYNCDKTIQR